MTYIYFLSVAKKGTDSLKILKRIYGDKNLNPKIEMGKVNSVQEACAKCFAVHFLKFEILQIT